MRVSEVRSRRVLVALLAVVLISAACTGGGGANSASPTDLATLFLQKLKSPTFTGRYIAEGVFRLGSGSFSVSGQGRFRGWDSDETDTLSAAGSQQVSEEVTVQGVDYEKDDDGPWVQQPGYTTNPFNRLEAVRDVGTELKDGQRLHHLRPGPGFGLEASDLSLPDVQGFTGSLDFYANDDAVPILMVVSASWTQGDGHVMGATTYRFSDIGAPVTVSAPSEVWNLFDSKRFHYQIAYPPEWNVVKEKAWDELTGRGPAGGYPAVRIASGRISAAFSLADWVRDAVASNLRDFGKRPEFSESAHVGGDSAEVLRYHATNKQGDRVFFLDAEVVHEARGYSIYWASLAGSHESADRARFQQFLSTFAFES